MLAALAGVACSEQAGQTLTAAQRGERVYKNVCITCHNPDPTQDGSVGPAVAGASRELVEARVLRAEYPPGYTPKRPSNAMPPMPYLKDSIDDLAAYLAEAARL
jgi:mono/diheme cytochrome c family protein